MLVQRGQIRGQIRHWAVHLPGQHRPHALARPDDRRVDEPVAVAVRVVVAVLDTGYRPHADLASNILPGYDMISDSTTARDGSGRDSDPADEGDWFNAGECNSQRAANSSCSSREMPSGALAFSVSSPIGASVNWSHSPS